MERWLQRYRGVLFFGLTLLAVTGLAFFEARRREPVPLTIVPSSLPEAPAATPTQPTLRVYVSGAVQSPDVYLLPPGSIVKDAVFAAGGPATGADLDRINLAQAVGDGDHVHVPSVGTALPLPEQSSRAAVNINTADVAALEALPGIGPELARQIVAYRQSQGPFDRVEDIMNVTGIGPGIFDQVRELITTK